MYVHLQIFILNANNTHMDNLPVSDELVNSDSPVVQMQLQVIIMYMHHPIVTDACFTVLYNSINKIPVTQLYCIIYCTMMDTTDVMNAI